MKNLFTLASLILLISVFSSCLTSPEHDAPGDPDNPKVPEVPNLIDPGETAAYGQKYVVSWSKAERAMRYTIQESTDSTFTSKYITSSDSTDSTDKAFSHLEKTPVTYYYRVKGVNVVDDDVYESVWSNIVDITVNPQAPASPANLQANTTSSSCITLTWTDNSDNELGYTIERRISQGTYAVIDTVVADRTTFEDSGLAPDTRYSYRIRAFNDGGTSGYSGEADAKTMVQYTLTLGVNQSGWGTTNPSIGAHSYDDGATVTVTATPASGYQFVGWTGNVADTGKSSTTVTITGDMTVTANFEKHDGGTIIIDIPWPE